MDCQQPRGGKKLTRLHNVYSTNMKLLLFENRTSIFCTIYVDLSENCCLANFEMCAHLIPIMSACCLLCLEFDTQTFLSDA